VPGFFEDWHDGVAVIREVFAARLAVWYLEAEKAGRTVLCPLHLD
jgi:hypothetical protein